MKRPLRGDELLQAFVITLREGIEAALAVAIALSYLKRVDRQDLARPVYAGVWAAIVVSVIGAVVVNLLAVNTDAYEGYFMVVGAGLVATLVYWMWRTSRGVKGEIEEKLGRLVERRDARPSIAMFLFSFLMVGREGVEMILMLTGVGLNTDQILKFTGGLLGIVTAVVFGVLFVRGAIRVNLRQFFTFTTAILFLVAAQLLINGLHELSEAHVLPSSSREMAVVGPIVNNDAFFFIAILLLSAILFLVNRPSRPQPTPEQVGRAEWRLHIADFQRQQRVRTLGGWIAILLCFTLAAELAHERALAQPPVAETVAMSGGVVRIPLLPLRDGRLHLYQVKAGGCDVKFMAVRTRPGEYRSAFDACAICRTTFYYQSGANIICSNCGSPLDITHTGEAGGCNPVPLPSAVIGSDFLQITSADLEKESERTAH